MNQEKEYLRNKTLFRDMDKWIREKRLFVKPGFTRDDCCHFLGIDRNRFAFMIRQQSGAANFSQYLNKLRLDLAMQLMTKHPQWSINVITKECGMTLTPFKRNFKNQFGLTPSQARRQIRNNNSATINNSPS